MNGLPLHPRSYGQAQACIHCGLCLPACPTYTETGLEADSPRGRIHLMKAMADGRIGATGNVVRHLDLCLDCRACEPACPSGVVYHELIEDTRGVLAEQRRGDGVDSFMRWLKLNVLAHAGRLRLALLPARLLQRAGLWPLMMKLNAFLPARLANLAPVLPPNGPLWPRAVTAPPVVGEGHMTVGFHAGCVGGVLWFDVGDKAVDLLRHLGCRVVAPPAQTCCGAIHHHNADPSTAADMARRNIELFEHCDRIVTITAGCGAMLKEYDHLLRDEPAWAERARAFVAKARDITELIAELNPPRPPRRVERTVAYHAPCHLVHAQGVHAPEQLLAQIDGLVLRPIAERDTCCGAAGTYNLDQPEMSQRLAERKLRHIIDSTADTCVTGNIGCALQIAGESRRRGQELTVMHPVELLHAAYLG